MFEARVGEKELFLPQRRRVLLRLKIVMYGQRRHKFKRIFRFDRGKGVSPSFSQNLKQVLFMPEFWCVRRKILRHYHLCLVTGKFLVKAPQLPAPCTFPSAVWGSSWVSCTFSSTVQAPSWVLRLPELWACKSIEEEKGLEAVANLSSAPPPRLYLIPLYLPFQLCSELWRKLIPAFHCTLYYFFVLVKRKIYLLVLNATLFATPLCERVCSRCMFL